MFAGQAAQPKSRRRCGKRSRCRRAAMSACSWASARRRASAKNSGVDGVRIRNSEYESTNHLVSPHLNSIDRRHRVLAMVGLNSQRRYSKPAIRIFESLASLPLNGSNAVRPRPSVCGYGSHRNIRTGGPNSSPQRVPDSEWEPGSQQRFAGRRTARRRSRDLGGR
jgi:hypothetical protein